MNDDPSPKDNRGKGVEPGFNWRGVILFAIAFALIGGAIVFRGGPYGNVEELTYPRFVKLLEEGRIISDPERPVELVIEDGRTTQYVRGYYRKALVGGPEAAALPPAPAAVSAVSPGVPGASPAPDLVQFKTPVYINFNRDLEE